MHTCTPWPSRVTLDARGGVEALGLVELALVAVRTDEQQHDPLPGAHRHARDLGVDEQRAADELQRQLVTEHLLERAVTAPGCATSRRAARGGATAGTHHRRRSSAGSRIPPMKSVTSCRRSRRRRAGRRRTEEARTMSGDQVDAARRSRVAAPRGDEAAEVVVDLAPRRHARGADAGFVRLALHVTVHQRDEGDAVARPGTSTETSGDRGRNRRRVVVAHVELVPARPACRAAPPRARARRPRAGRRHGAGTDRSSPGAARVCRRVEHREAAHRPSERGVGRAVVVAQEPVTVEDGALDDGEALADPRARATRRRTAATPRRRTRRCGTAR